ncbi:hypothetical protein MRB53_017988 [Persea americana]|uniref:Uncharacterized protein n=1 Tax=Persea americana TaxID=3435 RepID=A0ACC2M7K4_PERAE|nr:hypothetical protein MRB53_017988 [Persea americana]|eukprot:TRINITY_DN845_c0_g2_i1.p1 TRINITY_DN845_c0_g2~~TRINITY_DN845_c0_g2_i1.p1  ORF type:complete len:285 (+),score=96.67 TRINITY_DN845_c0_g2_i1:246-1100(+)
MEMEFWGVEVKAGQPIKCDPATNGKLLHLSQASLGEVKKDKGSDSVPLSVKIGDQKLVIGILSSEKCTHMSFDLVFEKEFELSHNWKHGSVYFCGYYTTPFEEESEDLSDTDSDSEGDHAFLAKENGKNEVKDEKPKLTATKANGTKPEASVAKPKDMVESGNDSDEDDEEEDSEDESSEEDEATPKKAEAGKKRPIESAMKTPVMEKKAKLSGQKSATDGKKGGHIATPYPSKQAGRKHANDNTSKPNTPKSGGQVTCNSCSKTFNSENALQSHAKAKHSTGK